MRRAAGGGSATRARLVCVKGLGGALSMQYLTLLMCMFGPVFFGHGRYGWPLLFCWPVLLAAAIFAARRNGGRA